MESRFSFICAYANVSSSGNINAAEIFSDIGSLSFPCSPRLMFVSSTRFEMRELGGHKFRLTFIDADGKDIIKPIIGDIAVNPPIMISNIILNFNNLSFPSAGTYQIDLSIDGVHLNTDTINIVQLKAQ